jgi:hypothetical protein
MTFICAFQLIEGVAPLAVISTCLARKQVEVVIGELYIEIAEGEIDAARKDRGSYPNLVTSVCAGFDLERGRLQVNLLHRRKIGQGCARFRSCFAGLTW